MKKILITLLTILFANQVFADGFSVSGEAHFTGKGVLLMELVTQSQFDNEENGIGIGIGTDDTQGKKVAFSFENVPAGSYVLQGFQDVNGNGELDSGAFGPSEPWVIQGYKASFSQPDFDKCKIEIDADIADLEIKLKK